MKLHEKILTAFIVILIVSLVSFFAGYTRSDRQRSVENGDLRAGFESELGAERSRNSELERLHKQDGIVIDGLRSENSDLRTELDNQTGFIDNLGGILEQDRDTIRSILELIGELRESIRLYKESLNSVIDPDPG